MTDGKVHAISRPGRTIAAVTISLVAGAVILLWWWNAFIVDLFAAPAIDFRHAFATELVVAVLTATIGLGIRLATAERQRSGGNG